MSLSGHFYNTSCMHVIALFGIIIGYCFPSNVASKPRLPVCRPTAYTFAFSCVRLNHKIRNIWQKSCFTFESYRGIKTIIAIVSLSANQFSNLLFIRYVQFKIIMLEALKVSCDKLERSLLIMSTHLWNRCRHLSEFYLISKPSVTIFESEELLG